ncbi:unnamed protein product, partial [Meganyctiphanes norvegica]
ELERFRCNSDGVTRHGDCDPASNKYCCSPAGWCGNSAAHCDCGFPYPKCRNLRKEACWGNTCGTNGECYWDDTQKKMSCMCKASYYKDTPSGQCYKCLNNDHCLDNEACRSRACQNVCGSGCAQDAYCSAQNHKMECTCLDSLVGNPYPDHSNSGCFECVVDNDCSIDKHCRNNHCSDPCHDYCKSTDLATCEVINHKPICSCREGYKLLGQTVCEATCFIAENKCSEEEECIHHNDNDYICQAKDDSSNVGTVVSLVIFFVILLIIIVICILKRNYLSHKSRKAIEAFNNLSKSATTTLASAVADNIQQ